MGPVVLEPLIIWGAGGHAKVVAEAAIATGGFEIVGFIDDVDPRRAGEDFLGSKIVGGRSSALDLRDAGVQRLGLGIGDNRARLEIASWARNAGFGLPSIVHPSALVSASAEIGQGAVCLAGSVLSAASTIGDLAIINTGATVDHDCVIGEGAHVCPGVNLAGNVTVGQGALLGVGAVVLPRIQIGVETIVGAGSVVIRDVPDRTTVIGNPARKA